MFANTDYVGIATLITAIGASIASILAVFIGRGNSQKAEDIHAAVTTPPNTATIGQLVADSVDLGNAIKKAVNGNAETTSTPADPPHPSGPHSL